MGQRLTAELLARWLRERGGRDWWFLDGEREVAATLDLPAQGDVLAAAILRHGGELALVLEDEDTARPSLVDVADVDGLVDTDGDSRAIELAWIEGGELGEPWLLVESSVARDVEELADAGSAERTAPAASR